MDLIMVLVSSGIPLIAKLDAFTLDFTLEKYLRISIYYNKATTI